MPRPAHNFAGPAAPLATGNFEGEGEPVHLPVFLGRQGKATSTSRALRPCHVCAMQRQRLVWASAPAAVLCESQGMNRAAAQGIGGNCRPQPQQQPWRCHMGMGGKAAGKLSLVGGGGAEAADPTLV